MYPLIEIKTVPIEIEVKTTRAKLEYSRGTAEMEISRDQSGLQIKSRPIRLNMDTLEVKNLQLPRMTSSNVNQSNAQPSYTATATYAQQGQLLLSAHMEAQPTNAPINAQIQRHSQNSSSGVPVNQIIQQASSWDKGDIQIRYEMDKLNFDFRIGAGDFNFVPGDIEISVTQQPDLIIKYIGGPLYVPPSADPNYEPVDVQA